MYTCGWNKKWYTKKFLCLRKCAFQQKYFVLKFESTYSFPSPLAYILNIVFNSIIFLPFFIFFVHGCVVLPILHCVLIVCPFVFYLKLLGNSIHFATERIPIYTTMKLSNHLENLIFLAVLLRHINRMKRFTTLHYVCNWS